MAKADKKASRVAAEGKIAVSQGTNKAVMVEVNCETDFVAKDGNFLGFCNQVAEAAASIDGDSVEDLMATKAGGDTLEAVRQGLVAKIGENIQVRRMVSRGDGSSTVGAYVHMNKIGVMVELDGGNTDLCTDVAMHIAAMNPPYATADDVPAEVLEKEKRLLSEQALESGKPADIVEKMVEGTYFLYEGLQRQKKRNIIYGFVIDLISISLTLKPLNFRHLLVQAESASIWKKFVWSVNHTLRILV